MIASEFDLRSVGAVTYYSCLPLRDLGIRHGFTTRAGGVDSSRGDSLNLGFVPWDEPGRVMENRSRVLEALGLASVRLATLSQVHSDLVHIIEETADQGNRREGDALVAQQRGVALAVLVADCFPVLLTDPAGRTVAAVHSGWRGTANRIVLNTVNEMRQRFGCKPSHLLASIGPGIRSCCFEVGKEVGYLFADDCRGAGLVRPVPDRPGKYLLDLPGALKIQLLEAGLHADRLFDLDACTRCNPREFFSYRAEGPRAGRQMAIISPND